MSTETKTPAQELRAAASKIRGFAGIAPKGPWCAYTESVTTDWDPGSPEWQRLQCDEEVASNTDAASEHIALWHPGVAELVAVALDEFAASIEGLRTDPFGDRNSLLNIARAINGEVTA